jgi:hypothetical protein
MRAPVRLLRAVHLCMSSAMRTPPAQGNATSCNCGRSGCQPFLDFAAGLDVYKRCCQDFRRANRGPPSFCQLYLPASCHFAVPSNARPPGPDLSGKDSNVVSVYSCCQYGAASGIVHLKVYTEASTAPAAVCHRGRQPGSLPARTGAGSQAGLLVASSISLTASRRQRLGGGSVARGV